MLNSFEHGNYSAHNFYNANNCIIESFKQVGERDKMRGSVKHFIAFSQQASMYISHSNIKSITVYIFHGRSYE